MARLIDLAIWLLTESARAGGVRSATMRVTAAALCAGLAAMLLLAALGCVAASLWIFSLPSFGPVGAPLIVAASLSAVISILLMAAWLIMRRRRTQLDTPMAPQLLLSEATRLFTENKGAGLLAALAAGMAAGSSGHKP